MCKSIKKCSKGYKSEVKQVKVCQKLGMCAKSLGSVPKAGESVSQDETV